MEYESVGFPTKTNAKDTETGKNTHFVPDQMLGALENWFTGKSSVELMGGVRGSWGL